MCNWCVGNVCDRCYVDHTSTHESIHSPSVAQKRKTEKCGAVFESAKCDLAWGHDSADHADKGVTWPRNAV